MAKIDRCPSCMQQVPVRDDGTIVPHQRLMAMDYGRKKKVLVWCAGQDKKVGDI